MREDMSLFLTESKFPFPYIIVTLLRTICDARSILNPGGPNMLGVNIHCWMSIGSSTSCVRNFYGEHFRQ